MDNTLSELDFQSCGNSTCHASHSKFRRSQMTQKNSKKSSEVSQNSQKQPKCRKLFLFAFTQHIYAVQKWTKINFDTPALFRHFPTFQPVPPILRV